MSESNKPGTPLPNQRIHLDLSAMIGKSFPPGSAMMMEFQHDADCFALFGGDCRCIPNVVLKPYNFPKP